MSRTSWSHIWSISWPIFLANITVPLVGAADTAMMGRLSDPAFIGGVALGSLVFNFLYFGLGFVRMCTTGLVAQAHGREDESEIERIMVRGLVIAISFGILAILSAPLTLWVTNLALAASERVESLMNLYVGIRLYAVPAALGNMVLLGVLFGRQQMRLCMLQLLLINLTNLGLNLFFVLYLGMQIEGVALASVIAQWSGFGIMLAIISWRWRAMFAGFWQRVINRRPAWLDVAAFGQFFVLGRDLVIRTVLLLGCEALLLNNAAMLSDLDLAAAQLAMTVFALICFGLDGYAHAAEALVGEAIGRKDRQMLDRVIWRSTIMAAVTSMALFALAWIGGGYLIRLLTTQPELIAMAEAHWFWIVLMAPTMVIAMQMDGIFVGATLSREMRNGMIVASLIFAATIWMIAPYGLVGLLIGFNIYLLVRGFALLGQIGRVQRLTSG